MNSPSQNATPATPNFCEPSLVAGLTHTLSFTVPENKTVPHLYPESESFREMPEVFATGFMVGLMEWCCLELVRLHQNWPQFQTVGTHVDFSHLAATAPGMTITVDATLDLVEGRRLVFSVKAHDGVDLISQGRHERFLIDRAQFDQRLARKRQKHSAG